MTVRNCSGRQALPAAPLQQWSWCTPPWDSVYIVFMKKEGKFFLVAFDSFSKWLEVRVTNSTSAGKINSRTSVSFPQASHSFPEEGTTEDHVSGSAHKFRRSLRHRVDNFLFAYRNTPHTLTNQLPRELFLGRKVRVRLNQLKPDLVSTT